jgi:hypothetical protein
MSMISPSGAIAFATNCLTVPDRLPLRQLVGFVISSSPQERPPQYPVNNASSSNRRRHLRLCCVSDSDRSFLRARQLKPQSEDLFFELARALATLFTQL